MSLFRANIYLCWSFWYLDFSLSFLHSSNSSDSRLKISNNCEMLINNLSCTKIASSIRVKLSSFRSSHKFIMARVLSRTLLSDNRQALMTTHELNFYRWRASALGRNFDSLIASIRSSSSRACNIISRERVFAASWCLHDLDWPLASWTHKLFDLWASD